MFLFLRFLEDNPFAEFFGVFFELDFALYFALVFARPIHLTGIFVD